MHHILTLPLTSNYGGILQAYALKSVVEKLGYPACLVEHVPEWAEKQYFSASTRIKCHQLKEIAKFLVKFLIGRPSLLPTFIRYKQTERFKRRFFRRSSLDTIESSDTIIVGSDQVWRAVYARTMGGLERYFLNFATSEQRARSFFYAASFGSDEWEGTPQETERCQGCIADFKAISVRETSGINLCRKVFGVNAIQLPDPTLLLPKEEYEDQLIHSSRTKAHHHPYAAAYILDSSPAMTHLLESSVQFLALPLLHLIPTGKEKKLMDRLPLSVPQWLRGIRDCKCVLTDSFHGCVFSIIFNKPFICLGNESRGSARFDSLLGTFGLQDRLVTNPTPETIQKLIYTTIDWERVNAIRHSEQQRAFDFLRANLEK